MVRLIAARELLFGDGEERVPDRPGIDRPGTEGGGGIGGAEKHRLDIFEAKALRLQRRNRQVPRAGARDPDRDAGGFRCAAGRIGPRT